MSAIRPRLLIVVALLAPGCDGVREDRTIVFSGDGERVAFQHGADGVFVASRDGTGLTKIFAPPEGTVATSTPRWSPDGSRLVFCTAAADATAGRGAARPPRDADDPAGAIHGAGAVVYTCWLREGPPDSGAEPTVLFRAACDHPGYVAADLAVRWHPDGRRVLFVDRISDTEHGLFTFDADARTAERFFGPAAPALAFDVSPEGDFVTCVLFGRGMWLIPTAGGEPWQVFADRPGTITAAAAELPSPWERLRATLPAWSPDGGRFLFATATGGNPESHAVQLGDAAARTVTVACHSDENFADTHWHPDGDRFGVVTAGRLRVMTPEGDPLPGPDSAVGRFAGWSADGTRMAYTIPEATPLAGNADRAVLLAERPGARERIIVAGPAGEDPRAALSGMRLTFPRWSPTEPRLTLWVTFVPPYGSRAGLLLGTGLRPGDPAVVLDAESGEMAWMPVNPRETEQIGHYHLLRREYAAAWDRYAEAAAARGGEPDAEAGFFRWYCLDKLGHEEQARAELERHLGGRDFLSSDPRVGPAAEAVSRETPWLAELLAELYRVEVFLALDAADDGAAFFRDRLAEAGDDGERFARAVALSQLLALLGEREEHARLARQALLPARASLAAGPDPGEILSTAGHAAMLPLMSPDYLADMGEAGLRELAETAVGSPEGDRVRRAALTALGRHVEAGAIVPAEPPALLGLLLAARP